MTETKKRSLGIKKLTQSFWGLSRVRQEAFLKNLYELSPENKALFHLRLSQNDNKVLETLIQNIEKETLGRIGRFRKLRCAKINEILRNAEKYGLPMLQQIELKKTAWNGMLQFILHQRHHPERYETACARHLDQYITMVKHHILEASEVEERLQKDKVLLTEIIQTGVYLPHIEDVYLQI